jgi:hypothetical protein
MRLVSASVFSTEFFRHTLLYSNTANWPLKQGQHEPVKYVRKDGLTTQCNVVNL